MARKRFSGLKATIGTGGLAAGATSMPLAAALTYNNGTAVPTVASPDYIPLEILDGSGRLSEIVWGTYTSGATSVTVTRGREGTPDGAHSAGATVDHGATALDFSPPSIAAGATDRLGLNLTKQGIIVAKGATGAWDADLVESPSVMYDPKSGKWAMVYAGYGTTSGAQRAGVGLAYSTDGVTWTKQGTAAILPHSGTTSAPDENGASGPVLLWDNVNAQYVLYYIGLTATGYEAGFKSICYATATSLTGTWTRHGAVVTTQASTWRSNAVWHTSVVEREGIWYMFFNATNASSVETIGYATAPAITGPWTVDDTNSPIVSTGTGWEAGIVGDPSVRRVGDMWVMTYYGTNSGSTAASDGIAVCADHDFPIGPWVKYSGNPVLAPGASYDAQFAHKPWVIYRSGVLFHYYTAVDASNVRQIALATEGLAGIVVQDENVTIATGVTQIDFQGAGVTATAGTGEVVVTIPGATSSGAAAELLMADGVTSPPVPIETEAGDDWLYQD